MLGNVSFYLGRDEALYNLTLELKAQPHHDVESECVITSKMRKLENKRRIKREKKYSKHKN